MQAALAADAAAGAGPVEPPRKEPKPPEPAEAPEPEVDSEAGGLANIDMGVSQKIAGKPPKWMVFNGKPY